MKSGQRTQSKYGGKCSGYAKQEIGCVTFQKCFFFFDIVVFDRL